jgi:hypothetical protein
LLRKDNMLQCGEFHACGSFLLQYLSTPGAYSPLPRNKPESWEDCGVGFVVGHDDCNPYGWQSIDSRLAFNQLAVGFVGVSMMVVELLDLMEPAASY